MRPVSADQEARRRILKQLFGQGGDLGLDAAAVLLRLRLEHPAWASGSSSISTASSSTCAMVKIGDFTLFGPAVQIYTATHPMNAELRRKQEFAKPIEIGSDVWVGGGAIICPGVKIGSKSVIGAGSVVTRDIPDGVFAAGNPCRVIREITE